MGVPQRPQTSWLVWGGRLAAIAVAPRDSLTAALSAPMSP